MSKRQQPPSRLSQTIPAPLPAGTVIRGQTIIREGPLPPATDFAEYERILPGAADRIMSLAEKDQEIRARDNKQNLDRQDALVREASRRAYAQTLAGIMTIYVVLALAALLLLVGVYMITIKDDWYGAVLASPAFLAVCVQMVRYVFPSGKT